jgi:hypothetical protein
MLLHALTASIKCHKVKLYLMDPVKYAFTHCSTFSLTSLSALNVYKAETNRKTGRAEERKKKKLL